MITQPVAIVHVLAGADAEQDVVRAMVAVRQIVHVVGRHQRHVQLARDGHEPFVDDELLVDALVLHLEEQVAVAEDVPELRRRLERLPLAAGPDLGCHLPLQAAAEADQPLGVPGEQVFVDARLVVEPFRVARRDELDEVLVTLVGLGQQNQVVRRLTYIAAFRQPAAGRDVHLASENRLYSALLGVIVKNHRREHVPVLGDRQRRHLEPGRLIEELVDAARAVEQREFSVTMQMNEMLISHWVCVDRYRRKFVGSTLL